MKKLLIGLLALGSVSAFAKCPDINGVFACTGLFKLDSGRIVKIATNTNQSGLTEVQFNNEVYMTEGKSGVFCNNNTIKDSGRSILQLDNETLDLTFSWKAGNTAQSVSSTCVRLR